MRIFLSVHCFAPKLALEGDMGWMLSRNRQFICVLRLWNRLLNLPDDRMTKQIFINDFYLAQSGHKKWCSNVYKILLILDQENIFYERPNIDIKMVKKQLSDIHEKQWLLP